jgi:hypothetical protein
MYAKPDDDARYCMENGGRAGTCSADKDDRCTRSTHQSSRRAILTILTAHADSPMRSQRRTSQSSCSLNYGGVSSPYIICSSQHYQVITVDIHIHTRVWFSHFATSERQPRPRKQQEFHMDIYIHHPTIRVKEKTLLCMIIQYIENTIHIPFSFI